MGSVLELPFTVDTDALEALPNSPVAGVYEPYLLVSGNEFGIFHLQLIAVFDVETFVSLESIREDPSQAVIAPSRIPDAD